MLRLNYSNAHIARTARNFWNYSQHTSSVSTWENLHCHQPRDTNSRHNITRNDWATEWCKVRCNGVPTQLTRRHHYTRTPRLTTARGAVILAFDNYYDCMHNYDYRNPLLLPTFLFITQNITLFFYTQTSKSSYTTSSYSITLLHTPPRNKRSNKHRSTKERNFHDVLTTSHLEGLTLTASKMKRHHDTASSLQTSAREHRNSAHIANSRTR